MLRMFIEEELKTNTKESWEKITLDEIRVAFQLGENDYEQSALDIEDP